jgi:hypothetical protein
LLTGDLNSIYCSNQTKNNLIYEQIIYIETNEWLLNSGHNSEEEKNTKDTKTKQKFLELRAQGKSLRGVADELGIGLQTAVRWERELKEQIENQRAMELEQLQEEYWLTEHDRIKCFGGQLQQIRDQLNKRDLSDVETPKLLDMELKLDAALSKGEAKFAHKTPSERNKEPPVSVTDSPEYKKLQQDLMKVLEPYPEVRDEVSLRLLEAGVPYKKTGNDDNGKQRKH